jgi:2-C-methyl-D-erythritol 4-phosphate cytidylyltransferase / 2-C-methyl-D-erythritol 2,4-cyclodiphosphate synthase
MAQSSRTVALIVAAGSGSRLGGIPKQYQPLGGKALIMHSIERFQACPEIDSVYVVIAPDHVPYFVDTIGDSALPALVHGGATRQESVRAGLEQIAADGGCAIVLIHDAARPFVSEKIILGTLALLDSAEGAAPALAIMDSLRLTAKESHLVINDVPRDHVYRVQTPQCFHFHKILSAHQMARADMTDDIAVARSAGLSVVLAPGDENNFKITIASDLIRAENILVANKVSRSGFGYDVHRFGPGDHIWLGGVKIPHTQGIVAHSDGDVVLHAITDALLGTISAGDIGSHFPPSDDRWKNAASDKFVRHAVDMIRARGGKIDHVDVTVICERPKVGPHRDAIQARIADVLSIPIECVSVKATTTEGLGFTGRAEGIAAQAVATVRV